MEFQGLMHAAARFREAWDYDGQTLGAEEGLEEEIRKLCDDLGRLDTFWYEEDREC